MEAQTPDTIVYKGKEYYLPDVSDNKTLCCIQCVGAAFGVVVSKNFQRGVAGKYAVEDGRLVLLNEEEPELALRDMPHRLLIEHLPDDEDVSSVKTGMLIPFTGYLIICDSLSAYQQNYLTDFLRFRNAGETLELEFSKGLFVGSTDLKGFVDAARKYAKDMPRREDGAAGDPDFFHDWAHMLDVMRGLSPVLPRGRYSEEVYSWRYNDLDTECALCSALGSVNAEKGVDCEVMVAGYLEDEVREAFPHSVEFLEKTENGVRARAHLSRSAAKELAKYYSPGVVILSPKGLADEVREDLRAALAAYEDGTVA